MIRLVRKIAALVVLLFCYVSYSQEQDKDLVKLKDGTELRGIIIEQYPGKYIRLLQRNSMDTIQVEMNEIEALIRIMDNSKANKMAHDTTVADTIPVKKLYNQNVTQANLSFKYENREEFRVAYQITFLATRLINPHLRLGPCLSFNDIAENNNSVQTSIHLSVIGEYKFIKSHEKRISHYAGIAPGIHLDLTEDFFDETISGIVQYGNGFVLQAHFKTKFNLYKNSGFSTTLQLQYLNFPVKSVSIPSAVIRREQLLTPLIGIGMFF